MKVIFRFQDVAEIMNDEVPALEENVSDVQKVAHNERTKKDGKSLFLIHQCVDSSVFGKIIEEETTKGVRDKLKNLYDKYEKLKRKIEKVLRSLTVNFDYIVVFIEESNNLAEMKVEELQASLEANEMRLKQRNPERERVAEQTLQARFTKKSRKENMKQRKNLANDEKSSKNLKNYSNSIRKVMSNKYSGKIVNIKEVRCYNCQGFDHYARDCRRKKESRAKVDDEVKYVHAGENNAHDMLVMTNTQLNNE
ncbi:uncharacterized protein LOC127078732 [Lathyrus oleraceus]|uniref:uncharacterized protein LOC127078732 n=1 Tax=Pisum sativum TaxID=3888 RepID=UPI0021D194E8|nr:uncharacterized protein LOC127078732 [Pisum sativum]